MKHILVLAMLLGGLLMIGPTATAQSYIIEDLGTLGGSLSSARCINAAGQVVGWSETADGHSHAFRYTDGVGMEDLGSGRAYGINAVGQVVGYTPGGFPVRDDDAFVWTDGKRMAIPLPPGSFNSRAYGINDAGQVVGCHGSHIPLCGYVFRYTSDTGTVTLYRGFGYGINNNGRVVGSSVDEHAVRYTDGVGVEDLGTLGGRSSSARSINAAGQVVGSSTTEDSSTRARSFRYTDGVGMEDLGALAAYPSTEAINRDGTVVGSALPESVKYAFVYTDDKGMQDLNGLIEEPGWVLREATGINDVGQIVGTGLHDGEVRAYRLTPMAGR
jgi:probable HAF family extracellular repeat protein